MSAKKKHEEVLRRLEARIAEAHKEMDRISAERQKNWDEAFMRYKYLLELRGVLE